MLWENWWTTRSIPAWIISDFWQSCWFCALEFIRRTVGIENSFFSYFIMYCHVMREREREREREVAKFYHLLIFYGYLNISKRLFHLLSHAHETLSIDVHLRKVNSPLYVSTCIESISPPRMKYPAIYNLHQDQDVISCSIDHPIILFFVLFEERFIQLILILVRY